MSDDMQVRQTRQAGWQSSMDGATETRSSFGTSPRGHHYAIEVSRLGSDAGTPAWSRPFPTTQQAERAADTYSLRARGDAPPAPAPVTQAQRDASRASAAAAPVSSATEAAQRQAQAARPSRARL